MLKNARHEKFAQEVAAGAHYGDAYQRAGYKAKPGPSAKAGSRLAKSKQVKARVAELRKSLGDKSEMSREELRRYLVEVLRTPIGEINIRHRLCQFYRSTDEATEVRMPDKLKAAAELIKLCGWAEPEKVQLEAGGGLAALLEKIRK